VTASDRGGTRRALTGAGDGIKPEEKDAKRELPK
jgi:hypothetical protein